MDKGIRSSEFWLTLLAVLVGAVLASGLLVEGGWPFKIASVLGAVLAALGYTWQRTSLKKAALASLPAKKR